MSSSKKNTMQFNYQRHCSGDYNVPYVHPLLGRIFLHRCHWRMSEDKGYDLSHDGIEMDDEITENQDDIAFIEEECENYGGGTTFVDSNLTDDTPDVEDSEKFIRSLRESMSKDYVGV